MFLGGGPGGGGGGPGGGSSNFDFSKNKKKVANKKKHTKQIYKNAKYKMQNTNLYEKHAVLVCFLRFLVLKKCRRNGILKLP